MMGVTTKKAVLFSCAAIMAFSLASAAWAAPRNFDVASQEAVKAIPEFGRQAGVQVVAPADQLKGVRTVAVRGVMEVRDALAILIRGTGLEVASDDGRVIVLRAMESRFAPRAAQAPEGEGATSAAAPSSDKSVERVVVTGTRIKGKGPVGAPVITYDRDDIDRSGQSTIVDFLRSQREFGPGNQGEQGLQNLANASTVQLRGMPMGNTLVLINGRRAPSTPTADGLFFDLNNIPAGAVERVEVLPHASSAIYGSDALAGVVNIILRKDTNGIPIDVRYGSADGTDDVSASIAWGKEWDKGSVSLVGAYYKRNPLVFGERAITASNDYRPFGGSDFRITRCNPGNVTNATAGQNLPGLTSPTAGIPAGITGTPTVAQFQATAGINNRCNANEQRALIQDVERFAGLATGSYEFTPSLGAFAELMFTHRTQELPLGRRFLSRAVVPATNPFNPFGVNVRVDYEFRGTNSLNNLHYETDFFRGLGGLHGAFGDNWEWEAVAWDARSEADRPNELDSVNPTAIAAALADTNPATAFNPFTSGSPAPQSVLNTLQPQIYQQYYEGDNRGASGLLRGSIWIADIAVGAETFEETLISRLTPSIGTDFSFDRNVDAFFGEARLALWPSHEEGRDDFVSVSAAVRHDHYSDFGDATTPQYGIEFRPLSELVLRASYAEAFKAPQLVLLYGAQNPLAAGIFAVTDPVRNEVVRPAYLFGGSQKLTPETGDSTSIGATWRNAKLGLETSVTWWSINQEDRINGSPSPQTLVNNESVFSSRIVRGPSVGGVPGPITFIDATAANLGQLHLKGVDLSASYSFETAWGTFDPSIGATRMLKNQTVFNTGAMPVNGLGRANTDVWSPKWRGSVGLGWNFEPVSASVTGRYFGSYKDRVALSNGVLQELGDFVLWDVNARYDIGAALGWEPLAGAYVEMGAVDLFDYGPQFSTNSSGGYDPSVYDIRGRYVYFQIGKRF